MFKSIIFVAIIDKSQRKMKQRSLFSIMIHFKSS